MRVFLVNPNHLSFGIGVITPRWLYVLASATPRSYGDPVLVDETLAPMDCAQVQKGDVVGIGIHSGNCLRGYEVVAPPASVALTWSSAAFTPACFQRKHLSMAAPTPW